MKSQTLLRKKCVKAVKEEMEMLDCMHGPLNSPYEVFGHLMASMNDLHGTVGCGPDGEDLCSFLVEIAGNASRAIVDLNLTKYLGQPYGSVH